MSEPTKVIPGRIYSRPLLGYAVVVARAHYDFERYKRAANHLQLRTAKFGIEINKLLAGVGDKLPLWYPMYGVMMSTLLDDGTMTPPVERGRGRPAKNAYNAMLSGELGDEPDRPTFCQWVAYDDSGKLVENSVDQLIGWWIGIDRHDDAKNGRFVIFDNGSYEWAHGCPAYQWAAVPVDWLVETNVPPLAPRRILPITKAVHYSQLTRVNFAPWDGPMVPRRPARRMGKTPDSNGQLVTAGNQGYEQAEWMAGIALDEPYQALPLMDGVRGFATTQHRLCAWAGIKRKVYATHPTGVTVHTVEGQQTLMGERHRFEAFHGELSPGTSDASEALARARRRYVVENIGNWDEAIPEAERKVVEPWGLDFWRKSLAIDLSKTPIGDTAPEHPHTDGGPVMFVTSRGIAKDASRGWLLRAEFDGDDPARTKGIKVPWKPPYIKRFGPYVDPWGVRCIDDVVLVCERGRHRIIRVHAVTGEFLGVEWGDERAEKELGNRINNTGGGAMPRSWVGPGPATCRNYDIVAPEGLAIDYKNGIIYMASKALSCVRAKYIGAPSNEWWLAALLEVDLKTRYAMLSRISHGLSGPHGTFMTTTWTNTDRGGRPLGWVPREPAIQSKTVPSHVHWPWADAGYGVPEGPGGKTMSQSYAEAVDLYEDWGIPQAPGDPEGGRFLSMSAEAGIAEFTLRLPEDGPDPDNTRGKAGSEFYKAHHSLLYGPQTVGFIDLEKCPLPWWSNPQEDYYFELCRRVQPNPDSLLADPSFEAADTGEQGFTYSPAGSGWTFGGGSGVASAGSAFKPLPTHGSRVGFIQNNGWIAQKLKLSGRYFLRFYISRRAYAKVVDKARTARTVGVFLDGKQIATFTPSSAKLWDTASVSFDADGEHEIKLQGLDVLAGEDLTSFIDVVRLLAVDAKEPVPLPSPSGPLTIEASMYLIKATGTAPDNPLVTAVRVYVGEDPAIEVAVQPGKAFEISAQRVSSGDLTVGHSYVAADGRESERFSQTVELPEAPVFVGPTQPLQVVVTWVA